MKLSRKHWILLNQRGNEIRLLNTILKRYYYGGKFRSHFKILDEPIVTYSDLEAEEFTQS